MRIAFHAPLKPPDWPQPSGDRTMARLLIRALQTAGHQVELAARLRSRDGTGDPPRQARLETIGRRLADRYVRLVGEGRRPAPDVWFTYHLYYKAPDWVGPAVADALRIPYVVAEASVAHKRAGGPWDMGHRATLAALARADLVIGLNGRDRPLVERATSAPYLALRPFLQIPESRRQAGPARSPVRLIAVGMMRPGDKTRSFLVLADALGRLAPSAEWRLTLVGDGGQRDRIAAAFARFGSRVTFTGAVPAERLSALYRSHDVFVWPAVREAYGMALLEAQAHGLAAVAGDAGGVPDIVEEGVTGLLAPEGDAAAFADRLSALLADREWIGRLAAAGGVKMAREHDITGAARRLDGALRGLTEAGR